MISVDRNAQSRREFNNESELLMYNYNNHQQYNAYVMMLEDKGSMFDTLAGGCKYGGQTGGKKYADPLLEMCSKELRSEQLI